MKILSKFKIIILFKKIDFQLKKEDFQSVIEAIVRQAEKKALKQYTEDEIIKNESKIHKSIENIEVVSTLFLSETKCLHRTIVQYRLFRERYGMPVKMVIGV